MVIIDLQTLKTVEAEESFDSPLSIAIGNFDGVHKGHSKLIRTAVAFAKENGIKSAVWTFRSLSNKPGATFLTSLDEKLALFGELGADYALVEDFEAVRELSPEEFVILLKEKYHTVNAVCGYNFRFGKNGAGDSVDLKKLCEKYGLLCEIVAPVTFDTMTVSSTYIRELCETGELEKAALFSEHPFFISGKVKHGKALGRTMGSPTANVDFPEGHTIPQNGVYATFCEFDGEMHKAVTNIGIRPTFDDGDSVSCEVCILDTDVPELYGKTVKVIFVSKIRNEIKFENINSLVRQIAEDKCRAKEILNAETEDSF